MFRSILTCAAAALAGCQLSAQSMGYCSQRVVAGSPTTDAGDGGPATKAQLNQPSGVARDSRGNLYIADTGNHKIRVVDADGKISTFAGTGVRGSGGNGGPATAAQLDSPIRVAAGTNGDMYILEKNRVRRVRAGGVVETVAGIGMGGYAGDGGPATAAKLRNPTSMTLDAAGNLYVGDAGNGRVRRISPAGTITTVAGSGRQKPTSTGDGGPAKSAFLDRIRGLAVTADGTLYIGTISQIYAVTSDGILHLIAGAVSGGVTPADGVVASNARLSVYDLAMGPDGRLRLATATTLADQGIFTIEADKRLKLVHITSNGGGLLIEPDGTVTRALFSHTVSNYPQPSDTAPTILAGSSIGADPAGTVPGTSGGFTGLGGMASDANGDVLISDIYANKIRKLSIDGMLSKVAGTGATSPSSPDGAVAKEANIPFPGPIAISPAGEIYYTETYRYLVRKIQADGTIATVAGNSQFPVERVSYYGTSPRKATETPVGGDSLAFDSAGNLYVATQSNASLYRVRPDGYLTPVFLPNGPLEGSGAYLASDPKGIVWFIAAQSSKAGLFRIKVDGTTEKMRDLSPLLGELPVPFAIDAGANVYMRTRSGLFRQGADNSVRALSADPTTLESVSLDRSGNLLVADSLRLRVLQFPEAATCAGSDSPFIPMFGTVNAANYQSLAAPGNLITIFGQRVGPVVPAGGIVEGDRFLTNAGGTQVLIDDTPVPVIYASSGQTSAIIPFDAVETTNVKVQVLVNGLISNQTSVNIADTVPAIFTQDASGKGTGSILNEDYSVNSADNPARKGSVVMVFLTGLGMIDPPLEDGVLAPAQLSNHATAISATIEYENASVLYAGTAPGLVAGVSQVNLRIPEAVQAGPRTLTVYAPPYEVYASNRVTVHVR